MVKPLPEEVLEYLLYEKRLDSMRVEATWLAELERTKKRAEEAEKEADEAKKRAKKAKKEADEARKNAEKVKNDTEEAKKREEQERREKERLLQLLKQAGIDPNC